MYVLEQNLSKTSPTKTYFDIITTATTIFYHLIYSQSFSTKHIDQCLNVLANTVVHSVSHNEHLIHRDQADGQEPWRQSSLSPSHSLYHPVKTFLWGAFTLVPGHSQIFRLSRRISLKPNGVCVCVCACMYVCVCVCVLGIVVIEMSGPPTTNPPSCFTTPRTTLYKSPDQHRHTTTRHIRHDKTSDGERM